MEKIKLKLKDSQHQSLYEDIDGHGLTKKINKTSAQNLIHDIETLKHLIDGLNDRDVLILQQLFDSNRKNCDELFSVIKKCRKTLCEVNRKDFVNLLIYYSNLLYLVEKKGFEITY